jgi:hypothetical protein
MMVSKSHLSPTPTVGNENNDLFSVLEQHFGSCMNKARIKLISLFLQSLIKVQTVNFNRLANSFEANAKPDSSLRRIQRFFADYFYDVDLVAKLIFALIPSKEKYGLSLDRTNWKIGEENINILVLGIVHEGLAFPLLFKMMPKFGNSNCKERTEIMDKFNDLFGFEKIDYLVADREFIGKNWLDYLNRNQIKYHIRIRENFKVYKRKGEKPIKAAWLFSRLKAGQFEHYPKIVYINDVACYLSASVIKAKNGNAEYQFLISFNNPSESKECYKKRWQIETMFKALKSSGFNIEKTHLQDIERVSKLISLVFIAFVWCYKVGIYVDIHEKKIKIKKHGYRAKSLFKYGLDYIANIFLNPQNQVDINVYDFLSCS